MSLRHIAGLEEANVHSVNCWCREVGRMGTAVPQPWENGFCQQAASLEGDPRPSWEAQSQPVPWFDLGASWAKHGHTTAQFCLQTRQLMSGHCGELLGLREPVRQQWITSVHLHYWSSEEWAEITGMTALSSQYLHSSPPSSTVHRLHIPYVPDCKGSAKTQDASSMIWRIFYDLTHPGESWRNQVLGPAEVLVGRC